MRHRVYKKERNDRISKNADILAVRWQLAADVFFCCIRNPFLSDKQVFTAALLVTQQQQNPSENKMDASL